MDLSYPVMKAMRSRQAVEAARRPATGMGFEELRNFRQAIVVTYRRSGEPMSTPINHAISDDGKLYFRSEPHMGKMKRIRAPRLVGSDRRSGHRALSTRRLEQLDGVAGGILEQDLLAARPANDVVAEGEARGPQPLDISRDVVNDEVDAVPAAGTGCAPVGHRPPGRARRTAEQQPQVAAHDVGESGRGAGAQRKAEVLGVKGDGVLDVVDHVADVH
jgi:hypothetical protein